MLIQSTVKPKQSAVALFHLSFKSPLLTLHCQRWHTVHVKGVGSKTGCRQQSPKSLVQVTQEQHYSASSICLCVGVKQQGYISDLAPLEGNPKSVTSGLQACQTEGGFPGRVRPAVWIPQRIYPTLHCFFVHTVGNHQSKWHKKEKLPECELTRLWVGISTQSKATQWNPKPAIASVKWLKLLMPAILSSPSPLSSSTSFVSIVQIITLSRLVIRG